MEAALAELKAQEDAFNQKTEELKRKSEEGGVVSKNRAKNELAQHLAEDPLVGDVLCCFGVFRKNLQLIHGILMYTVRSSLYVEPRSTKKLLYIANLIIRLFDSIRF